MSLSAYAGGITSGLARDKIDPKNKSASSGADNSVQFANIMRDEWDDYLTRFAPRKEQLLDIASGDEDNLQAEQMARESTKTGFDVAQGSLNRDFSRYGLSETKDEALNRDRSLSMSKTASEVSAVNKARLHANDRDMKVIGGGMAAGLRESVMGGGL